MVREEGRQRSSSKGRSRGRRRGLAGRRGPGRKLRVAVVVLAAVAAVVVVVVVAAAEGRARTWAGGASCVGSVPSDAWI